MSSELEEQIIPDLRLQACGCKGVRTCLLCESAEKVSKATNANLEVLRYRYCNRCDVCWLAGTQQELRLGGIVVIQDFISESEQDELRSAIDNIPWMPSQSGRRKQDFGPKVNFKKRKLKTGNFIGFPEFAFPIVKRLSEVEALSDFEPVELCHLEYVSERGSAIEPHLDDNWLWGERLVTLNLLSDTVLTLTPCEAEDISNCTCVHKFHTLSHCLEQEISLDNKDIPITHQCAADQSLSVITDQYNQLSTSTNEKHNVKHGHFENRKIEILIDLPAKSLLVLSGCARHHWFHQIKRDHVDTRRLAMTFRELSLEFQNGGSQYDMGQDLLATAKKIADL